jgi:Kef-type K+ transport system membrane component KefB
METLTLILLLLAAAYVTGESCARLRLPRVLGPLFVGLVLGVSEVKSLLHGEDLSLLASFADLGLVFIMFYVGLELDFRSMFRDARSGLYVAVLNIIIPFAISAATMLALGYGVFPSVITGIIICVTAEAMSVNILKELKLLTSRIGGTIIMAATFDDLVEILFLAGLAGYIERSHGSGWLLLVFHALIFFTLIYATRFLIMPHLLRLLQRQETGSQLFITGTLMVLLVSVVSDYLEFGKLIGAFIAGILVKYTLIDAHEYREQNEMKSLFEAATFGLLAPFFFIWIGMQADITSIVQAPVLGLILTVLAFGTKILASVIGMMAAKGSAFEGLIVGVATANKGIVEVVAAQIAFSAGIISAALFSAIIFMTVLTTVLSPLILGTLTRKISIS